MRVLRLSIATVVLFVCALGYCQSPGKSGSSSDAQTEFTLMKTLAGNWQGSVTSDNPAWGTDKPILLSISVASHGNALIHELNTGGPELTVFYMEDNRLALTHYCDLGNRPHMVAQPLNQSKVIEFDLVDYPGNDQIGHISHAVFTMVEPDHHIEDWTFLPTGGKPVHVHMDFKRVT